MYALLALREGAIKELHAKLLNLLDSPAKLDNHLLDWKRKAVRTLVTFSAFPGLNLSAFPDDVLARLLVQQHRFQRSTDNDEDYACR